ncbi:MAG TPA: hypothetical protein PKY77_23165 [Phycisphaerae bacterium]|nr:hypothetical protein [Phycisphaerae bacterium]HRY71311.1 hypothetical protein [Phycisphaerae bacterium]HSA29699.1 hypothetical protein [Phycisphaerae bacterium]
MRLHATEILILAATCATPWYAARAQDHPASGSARTILLVDDADVLYRSGTRREVRPFTRHHANPLIRCDKPWEVAIAWMSVYRNPETGLYQLWYQAFSGNRATQRTHACVVCYAESKDGIHFTKPELGLFPFNDIRKTNIVLIGAGGTSVRYANSVIVDPADPDPAKRYKMAFFDFGRSSGKEYPGLHVAFSPDGVHWTKHPEMPLLRVSYGDFGARVPFSDEAGRDWDVPLSMSDAVDVFRDTKRGVFAIYGKMWFDGPDGGMYFKHGMGRTESKDFVHWSKPQLVLTPDDLDSPWVEFHTAPVFLYEDVYFSLIQILDRAKGGGVIDIEMATSRDGLRWDRPFRRTFVLARATGNAFDSGSIFTSSTPVVLEEEIRFYYGAYSQGATGGDDCDLGSGIAVASIPRDRFAGIRPVEHSDQPTLRKPLEYLGQVTLKPIDLVGCGGILVNADASAGFAWVELLTEDGKRVRGFTRDDCLPIRGDSLRHSVTWKDRKLGDLAAGKYLLRLHLERAAVYSVTLLKSKEN